ncbi:MAG: hypothetical protein ACOZCE_12205 [Spirochaetota bacterium]|jgi:hypothetical protein|uniref:hypothetical protein n=1 Tax=Gracilinema caldarium TaxID=215591 RepID=UPI0026EB857C|nr:hypothetical protein [Gracilinema caldarium]HON12704.1 hypothetical protein [Treponema sp.]
MHHLDPDPEAFVEAARHFREILIDASSIIVLSDIGALETATKIWQLITIPEAAAEAGPSLVQQNGSPIYIQIVPAEVLARLSNTGPAASITRPPQDGAAGSSARAKKASTDLLLIETAKKHRRPLLAEDRKILMAAEDAGLDCFDSLVAIELLRGFSPEGNRSYPRWHKNILERNSYTAYRLSWAEQVAMAMIKLL